MSNNNSIKTFEKYGITKFKINSKYKDEIYKKIVNLIKEKKKLLYKHNNISLEKFHESISLENLNEVRLHLYRQLNEKDWIVNKMIKLFHLYIDEIVGNEIAIQKKVNVSIQIPNDNSSILPMHSDFFSGESLYQLNLWLPLVDVKKTSTMFYFLPKDSLNMINLIKKNNITDLNKIFKQNLKKIKWLNMKSGEGAVFSPNLLHGNIVNKENNTRFSLNMRVKNLYSPYNDIYGNEKKLGTFYRPYNLKAMTIFNLKNPFSIE
tara:strand:- start:2558 stop:3346 length:789 start_codon:yes stop_codon:yes gene_type:complete